MASKSTTTHRKDTTAGAADTAQYQQAAQQGTQQQMMAAAEATSQWLRGAEIWSQLQLHAVQRSGKTWREVSQLMRSANNPLEMAAAQNHLVMNLMLQGFEFAQELVQSAFTLQSGAAAQADEASGEAASTAMPLMPAPIMQAWQTLLNPAAAGLNGASASSAAS